MADNFPHLRERIDEFYARSTYAPRAYDQRLGELFDRLRRKHGFATDAERHPQAAPPIARPPMQLSLGVG